MSNESRLSNNKLKRLNNKRLRESIRKHGEMHEVCKSIVVGTTASLDTISVNLEEPIHVDGSVTVKVLGRRYRLVLEKLESPYTVSYWEGEKCQEFTDFYKALDFYTKIYYDLDPPRLSGRVTAEQQELVDKVRGNRP